MKLRLSLWMALIALLGMAAPVAAQEDASAASLYNQALELLKARKYAEAFPLLEKSLEIADPEEDAQVIRLAQSNGAIAAYYLGNELRKANKHDEALAAYERGIELNPNFHSNYLGQAMTMESKGKIVEAIKAYAKTGEVAERTGKGDKAGEALEKAENFAAVAWGEKKWDAVIEYAEAYLSIRETPDAHFYLASALKEKGQAAKGLEHVDKAIELAGGKDDGKYFFTKAEIHEALGQKDEAINAYKKVTDAKYSGRAKYKVDQLSGSR